MKFIILALIPVLGAVLYYVLDQLDGRGGDCVGTRNSDGTYATNSSGECFFRSSYEESRILFRQLATVCDWLARSIEPLLSTFIIV
jgi:hypothetical protein